MQVMQPHTLEWHCCNRQSMAVSGSKAVFGDVYIDDLVTSCSNGLDFTKHTGVDFTKPTGVYFNNSSKSCQKGSLSLRNRERDSASLVCGYYVSDVLRRNCNSRSLLVGPRLKNMHTSPSVCFSAGAAHDVSYDGNSRDEQYVNSSSPLNQITIGDRTLKLLSGSCYLPHPAKEETGGEDAHFICEAEQAIGVADGVGGWADVGVNAGLFSRELMSHSVSAIREEPVGSINPARVLEKAHSKTKSKGSSTACIIALADEGIRAINLGDSGFMVVRDGCTVFQSPVQQHGFNFTYQLESGNGGDLPSSGQVFTIPVAPGDVIIAGSDGLFDNLYNNEVTAVVVHALRAGLVPQVTAQKIAALARQRALNRDRQTPFSAAAQDAGFRYYGGKLDDITVVVSYITIYSNV
ncbi:SpoIIE domain-containing protein [Cephalotus follicularis]|uniref:Protein phosphatase n=1 Tax=Cephalotus follicularis TaxID=3775 RepID=A0A1Q3BNB0_CEPFO|nr:SpoIIE domain-containing protein [Cephalotus follicularis]